MLTLSQNKKIAISAIALFIVSFTIMLFFLEKNGNDLDHGQVDILDVTGHEDVEAEENDPEAIYREYLADEENPIFVIDAEGTIQFASDDLCRLLKVDCENFIESSFFNYVNTKDLPDLVAAHTKLIQDPEPTEGLGPYRILKAQKEILVLLNAYPIVDKDGKVIEIVFGMKDITTQAEELNDEGVPEEEDSIRNNDNWIEKLYPKINEMKDQQEIRMVVDKISYNSEE
jgi:PAS domain S-box-containing protein